MERLVIALAIVALVALVAAVVRRRRLVDPPTQRRYEVPRQFDRADFVRPDAPWLVAVFTSSTCEICRSVVDKAKVLESAKVAVQEVEFTADRELHQRYGIDAVPAVVMCGADGVTRQSFLGPVTATDLWAAMAEARDPGSTPDPHVCENRHTPAES
jgi:thioredoxin-related protein